jgi:flagellar brake protein
MFEETRPADLGATGNGDPYAEFRVTRASERLALLRELRQGSVPVMLNTPDGSSMTTAVWAVDEARERLNFSADESHPQLSTLLEADETVAVAYLDSVKLQFDLAGLVLVRSPQACVLQSGLPHEIYRFQRRNAYRVRTVERTSPQARFRHPSIPDMPLALRVLDVSAGGCALWQPHDVPALQAGTQLAEVVVELDDLTRFSAALVLQHVSALHPGDRGVRLGCAWQPLSGNAQRNLQRWIDQAQRRRRLLSLG